MAFFRPKRRKQAFIGRQNKRPSSAVLLPDAVARWRGRRALLQSPFGRHEVNIAEKRLEKVFIYQETEWFGVVLERSQLSGQSPLWPNLATRHACL